MTRQVTDQLYIELDYFTPEEYYVYTAEAAVALSSSVSVSCTISNIRGADLVAFSNASLSSTANVIKDTSATLTAQASIDQFIGNLYALRSASLTSEFAQTVDANRLREPGVALASAFTIDVVASINGAVVGSGTLASQFTFNITPTLFKDMGANLYADAVCDPDGVQRIRATTSSQSAEFAQSLTFTKIVQGECAVNALFTPSMTVEAVRNAFAVLDSTAALAVVANANRSAQVALSSIINQSLQGDRLRGYAANLSAEFAQVVAYVNTVPAQAALSSQFQTSTSVQRTRSAQASISSAFTPSITAQLTKTGQISLQSAFTQTATVRRTRPFQAQLSSAFTQTADATEIQARDFFVTGLDVPGVSTNNSSPSTRNLDSTSDSFGYVYSLGIIHTNTVSGNYDVNYMVTRHTPRGHIDWQKSIGTYTISSTYSSSGSIVENNGKLYASFSYWTGSTWIMRITQLETATGTSNWTKRITYANNTGGFLCDSQFYNNVIYTLSGSPNYGAIVHGFNTSGTQVFESGVYYNDGTDYAPQPESRMDITANGFFIPLKSYSTNTGVVARLSSDGSTVTARKINNFNPRIIRVDTSGNIYIAGDSHTATASNAVIKLNSAFAYQWGRKGFSTLGAFDNFIINNSNNIILTLNAKSTFVELDSSGTNIDGGVLRILNSSQSVNSIFHASNIQVDAAGWLQVSGAWIKSSGVSGVTEFATIQLQQDLSEPAFVQPVVSTFRDIDNNYLEWTKSYSFTSSTFTETVSTVTATTSGDGGITATSPATTVTNTAYNEIALFIRLLADPTTLSSQMALTASGTRVRRSTVALSAQAQATVTARKTARSQPLLQAQAQIVPNGGYVRGAFATLTSQATVLARPLRIKQLAATVSATSTIFVDPLYFEGGGASLNVDTTVQANLGLIKRTSISLQAFNTQISAVNRIGRGIIQCDVVALQTTQPVKTASGTLNAIVVVTQGSEPTKIARTSASVTAQSQVQANIIRIKSPDAQLQVQATVTANNRKIAGITETLTVQAVLAVNVGTIKQAQAQINAQATTTIQAQRLRDVPVSLPAQLQQQTQAVKTARATLNLQAFNTQVTVGEKIAFDKYWLYYIPNEQRTYLIAEETMIYTIESETRVNMIRG